MVGGYIRPFPLYEESKFYNDGEFRTKRINLPLLKEEEEYAIYFQKVITFIINVNYFYNQLYTYIRIFSGDQNFWKFLCFLTWYAYRKCYV